MSPRKITSIIEIQFSLYKKSFPYAAPEIGFVFFQTLLQKNALVAKFVIKDGLVATIGISWNVLIKKKASQGGGSWRLDPTWLESPRDSLHIYVVIQSPPVSYHTQ